MSILIADDQLAAKLARADWPVEICTRDGRRLGYFCPAKPANHNLEPRISEEEIQRRLADSDSESFTAGQVESKLRELRGSR